MEPVGEIRDHAQMTRQRFGFRWLLATAALLALLIGVPGIRDRALRAAGWALVAEDPLARADVIAIASDSYGSGVLEAADLFHAQIAPRVLVFSLPVSPVAREFARRGVQNPDSASQQLERLHALGVVSAERLTPPVAGTHDEARVLASWCHVEHCRIVVFVSTPDHSRRTRRILRRVFKADAVRVIVRYPPYSEFDPNSWWRSRSGTRTEIVELEKLLVELLGHPLG